MRSPCYDTKTKTDCPNRTMSCRFKCEPWQQYTKAVEQEREKRIKKAKAWAICEAFTVSTINKIRRRMGTK